MKAKLIKSDPTARQREICIDRFPVVIGRSPDAEIQPRDPNVSAIHCEIDEIDGRLMVRDLGSESGTFVNGLQVECASLLPGDKLTVAQCSFVASYNPPSPEAKSSGHTPKRNGKNFGADDENAASAAPLTFFDLVGLLESQRRTFREKYRGELSREEATFPDPPHPEHLEHLLVQEMKRAGDDPAVIYAFEKTGVLVTEFNQDALSEADLAAWQAAIEEYEQRQDGAAEDTARFPVGAVTMYGPDRTTTTMIVAAVLIDEQSNPVNRRWVGSRIKTDPRVTYEIAEFFLSHEVRSLVFVEENVGCAHEEGLDYPVGKDCPFCPYWKGRQSD